MLYMKSNGDDMSHTVEQAQLLRYMALITAARARIAGMEAENSHRVYLQEEIVYDSSDFEEVVGELRVMAAQLKELQQKLLCA